MLMWVDQFKDMDHDFAALLHKAGVANSADWVALIMFARNLLARLNIVPLEQRVSMQKCVCQAVQSKDFSKDRFDKVVSEVEACLVAGLSNRLTDFASRLASERQLSDSLVEEMKALFEELRRTVNQREKNIEDMGANTLNRVQSENDQKAILSAIRLMVSTMVTQAREEAKNWEERAKTFEHRALYDHLLTELYNRRTLDSYLPGAVAAAKEEGKPLALLLIDVDHFKGFNDQYGHQVGDDVLKALAKILHSHAALRSGFPARYGGEELVLVFENTDLSTAANHAEALRLDVAGYEFQPREKGKILGETCYFTVSVGVAELRKEWAVEDLLFAADSAMYRAKAEGRNQVVAYDDTLSSFFSGETCDINASKSKKLG